MWSCSHHSPQPLSSPLLGAAIVTPEPTSISHHFSQAHFLLMTNVQHLHWNANASLQRVRTNLPLIVNHYSVVFMPGTSKCICLILFMPSDHISLYVMTSQHSSYPSCVLTNWHLCWTLFGPLKKPRIGERNRVHRSLISSERFMKLQQELMKTLTMGRRMYRI